ncbi:MAG: hypothetical protein GKR89_13680 [Candidatus Latescibacteria bacterium]|nr:hypothetical protein [Candidatus Latescibacterota bacterium]
MDRDGANPVRVGGELLEMDPDTRYFDLNWYGPPGSSGVEPLSWGAVKAGEDQSVK